MADDVDQHLRALPSAMEAWPTLARQFAARKPALFLDYDGTLTPIAPRPELAVLEEDVRARLERIAQVIPVAIVTGRGRADARQMLALPRLVVAANHGLEIEGPGFCFEAAPEQRPLFDAIAHTLTAELAHVHGLAIESKGLSVAVHHRLTPAAEVPRVAAAIDRVVAQHSGVRKLAGKQVLEIRPALAWDKGKAVEWLLAQRGWTDHLPVFLGDDVTDEDALAAVRDRGVGIYVGTTASVRTHAHYRLDGPADVHAWLDRLIGLLA